MNKSSDPSTAPSSSATSEHGCHPSNPPRIVAITVNGDEFDICIGTHLVAELKKMASVPECDELSEVKNGHIRPLPNDGKTHIEGGEQFVSNPGSACNS